MKTTNLKLRKLIREALETLMEYGPGYGSENDLPPADSNWYQFSKALDIGMLDLDNIAYDMGFKDSVEMEPVTPKELAEREPEKFAMAVQDSSMRGSRMGPNEILGLAGAQARVGM